ncbi:MAG: hypothetical protein ACQET1_04740 [Gemmatimonadota bacterium]
MNTCAFCDADLAPGPPWAPGRGHRLAYDPRKGRLWNVCPACGRWNITPLEDRWETLEACEAAVHGEGREVLRTRHLSLVAVAEGELIRVGEPPRPEFVDWRYGPGLHSRGERRGFLSRILSRLPPPPPEGYDPYKRILTQFRETPWIASPFLEVASPLTYLFSQLPLAPECPSCRRPLALRPWEFQHLRVVGGPGEEAILAVCGFCRDEVAIPLRHARPTLRLALGMVTPPPALRTEAARAAEVMEESGDFRGFLRWLSSQDLTVGEMPAPVRAGLLIALDESAEAEALEAEWRKAEEVAAIYDGELSRVPGFSEFKNRILPSGS